MTHDGATEEALERVAEEDDLPTRAGKPVEPTEAAHAWQVEDLAPEVVLPEEDEEDEEEARSWAETFKVIAKYGGMVALVALVGLMFLDDHLPRHLRQGVAMHQTPVVNVPPPRSHAESPPLPDGPADGTPPITGVFPTVTGTVLPPTTEDSPPPVTVTESVPAPRSAGLAIVNPATTARFHALLKQDGLYSTESGPELAEIAQGVCEDSAYRHNVGPDIEATQRRNHMDYSTAGRMVYDVLDAFCPQYGDNPNPPGPHVDIGY